MKEVAFLLLATGLLAGALGLFAHVRRKQYRTLLDELKTQEPSDSLHSLKQQVTEIDHCHEMIEQYDRTVFHLCLWSSPLLLLTSAAAFSMI